MVVSQVRFSMSTSTHPQINRGQVSDLYCKSNFLAVVGFASALLGELVTGKGPLGQLQLELGLPPIGADIIIFGAIAYRQVYFLPYISTPTLHCLSFLYLEYAPSCLGIL